jgi:uncharacterized Fe-S cluster-containing radical SAM superfamily enzyme
MSKSIRNEGVLKSFTSIGIIARVENVVKVRTSTGVMMFFIYIPKP